MNIRVLIADDDPLIREGLEIILGKEEEITVAAVANNGKQAVELCVSRGIDVALLDIRMPVLDGVEAVKGIKARCGTRCLILTTFLEDELIARAVHHGARGYILKGRPPGEIVNAIKLVYSGAAVFQDEVFDKIHSGALEPKMDTSLLSERELDVVKLIAGGLGNKEIARELCLSEGTVKNYITSILSKLDLKQRTQIAVYYLKGRI